MPLLPSRRACLVVATLLTMPVSGVAQGATALDCLPPIPPGSKVSSVEVIVRMSSDKKSR